MLTQEELKEHVCYDAITGYFTRIIPLRDGKVGHIIGHKCKTKGYIQIYIGGKNYRAGRLAFLYMEGYFPENDVDHINRVRDDNRWKNLRHVSRQCNLINKSKQSNNTSGVTGVTWHKRDGVWQAQIRINKQGVHLGTHTSLLRAVQARWDAEVKYDFPNCNSTSSAYKYLNEVKP